MNKIKTSVVVSALLFATGSFASSTELAKAFTNTGHVKGAVKAWYFDRDLGEQDGSIGSLGLELGYVTPNYHGWEAGLGAQMAVKAFSSGDKIFNEDMKMDGIALSEAYLGFIQGTRGMRLGRQYIHSPLLYTSQDEIVNEAVQGGLWVWNGTFMGAKTEFGAGWFNDFQTAGNRKGKIGKFDGKISLAGADVHEFKNLSTVYLGTQLTENLHVSTQYARADKVLFEGQIAQNCSSICDKEPDRKENISVFHAEGKYKLRHDGYSVGIDAMYRNSDGAKGYEGSYYSARVGVVDFGGLNASLAYAQTDKNDDLIAGFGGGADKVYTATMIHGGEHVIGKDTTSYLVDLGYDFGKSGFSGVSGRFQYGFGEREGLDFYGYEAELAYRKSNIETALQFANLEKDLSSGGKDKSRDIRFKATYRF
ncbi:MAG: hypothetical protein IBX45_13075 [Campylobacterales bacterium]|nr:hypothetical protein [Campylobacterales bacterium]